ncbi:MAG: orotate phosphoribosyltransferase [Chitinispirillaceae bacterium]|nr:orotate phosphoribosyltransferase [Chitinispirillaceae bacterium]
MEKYKEEFIEFMVRCGVLTFGDFTARSGRKTPYFINTGNYRTGAQIRRLGEFYAAAINGSLGRDFDVLYGPAYKGIPLAVAAASALAAGYGHDVAFCFNRKETKDHGEGGVFIGHAPKKGDRVVIVEDVVTSGISVRESMMLLARAAPACVRALVVSVNRMERGTAGTNALDELAEGFGIRAVAIVTINEVTSFLHNRPVDGAIVLTDPLMEKIAAYRREFGAPLATNKPSRS